MTAGLSPPPVSRSACSGALTRAEIGRCGDGRGLPPSVRCRWCQQAVDPGNGPGPLQGPASPPHDGRGPEVGRPSWGRARRYQRQRVRAQPQSPAMSQRSDVRTSLLDPVRRGWPLAMPTRHGMLREGPVIQHGSVLREIVLARLLVRLQGAQVGDQPLETPDLLIDGVVVVARSPWALAPEGLFMWWQPCPGIGPDRAAIRSPALSRVSAATSRSSRSIASL
jgi:hypothetical protein